MIRLCQKLLPQLSLPKMERLKYSRKHQTIRDKRHRPMTNQTLIAKNMAETIKGDKAFGLDAIDYRDGWIMASSQNKDNFC